MFWVFGQEASRSVAPQSGIKPNPLHWKVETAKKPRRWDLFMDSALTSQRH